MLGLLLLKLLLSEKVNLFNVAPGMYNMYLGGGFTGERLNKLYKESIGEEEILQDLAKFIQQYAKERRPEEHFGDFVIRNGIVAA